MIEISPPSFVECMFLVRNANFCQHPCYALHRLVNTGSRSGAEWAQTVGELETSRVYSGGKEISLALYSLASCPAWVQELPMFGPAASLYLNKSVSGCMHRMNEKSLAIACSAVLKLGHRFGPEEVHAFFKAVSGKTNTVKKIRNLSQIAYSLGCMENVSIAERAAVLRGGVKEALIPLAADVLEERDVVQLLTAYSQCGVGDEDVLSQLEAAATKLNLSPHSASAVMHAFAKLNHKPKRESLQLFLSPLTSGRLNSQSFHSALRALSHWGLQRPEVQGIMDQFPALLPSVPIQALPGILRSCVSLGRCGSCLSQVWAGLVESEARIVELVSAAPMHALADLAKSLFGIDKRGELSRVWSLLSARVTEDGEKDFDLPRLRLLNVLVRVDESLGDSVDWSSIRPDSVSASLLLVNTLAWARVANSASVTSALHALVGFPDWQLQCSPAALLILARDIWVLTGDVREDVQRAVRDRTNNHPLRDWVLSGRLEKKVKVVSIIQPYVNLLNSESQLYPPPPGLEEFLSVDKSHQLTSLLDSVDPYFCMQTSARWAFCRGEVPTRAEIASAAATLDGDPIVLIHGSAILDEQLAIQLMHAVAELA